MIPFNNALQVPSSQNGIVQLHHAGKGKQNRLDHLQILIYDQWNCSGSAINYSS